MQLVNAILLGAATVSAVAIPQGSPEQEVDFLTVSEFSAVRKGATSTYQFKVTNNNDLYADCFKTVQHVADDGITRLDPFSDGGSCTSYDPATGIPAKEPMGTDLFTFYFFHDTPNGAAADGTLKFVEKGSFGDSLYGAYVFPVTSFATQQNNEPDPLDYEYITGPSEFNVSLAEPDYAHTNPE